MPEEGEKSFWGLIQAKHGKAGSDACDSPHPLDNCHRVLHSCDLHHCEYDSWWTESRWMHLVEDEAVTDVSIALIDSSANSFESCDWCYYYLWSSKTRIFTQSTPVHYGADTSVLGELIREDFVTESLKSFRSKFRYKVGAENRSQRRLVGPHKPHYSHTTDLSGVYTAVIDSDREWGRLARCERERLGQLRRDGES